MKRPVGYMNESGQANVSRVVNSKLCLMREISTVTFQNKVDAFGDEGVMSSLTP